MFIPLGIRTDYSLLTSLIKIKDLISYLKEHRITTCGLLDTNLYGAMEFYYACQENGIKPIIGLDVRINHQHLYLYAVDYLGYQNLIKINTIIIERELSIQELKLMSNSLIGIIPFASNELYAEITKIIKPLYISYHNNQEKQNALILTSNIVYLNETNSLNKEEATYLKYLAMMKEEPDIDPNYLTRYLTLPKDQDSIDQTIKIANLINMVMPEAKLLLPKYDDKIKNSWTYLASLAKKGLEKRLGDNIPLEYSDRLKFELEVIKNMEFEDYFLIVYDYVKFAKKNDILVGPGRGSAAGSLVSYVLGITNVDPLKYNLLFERFLNPERVSMPDIDLDFEFTKREQVIDYIRNRYGFDKVGLIMTYGTLSSKQVIRDVGKCLQLDSNLIDQIANLLDAKEPLKINMRNKKITDLISHDQKIEELFNIGLHLEGLKRHVSTHAAGVVICNEALDKVVPIYPMSNTLVTGVTMEYLERLGLLKMDLLALKNLTIIQNVVALIKQNTNEEIKINDLALNDPQTLALFSKVETVGIFQFETNGMKNFLAKLKPTCFSDLVAAVALFRPGPMENIDSFIKRKDGKETIEYLYPDLEEILKETYGIIVYQEQIMQILVKMGGYTYAEADNIRRAMSKKKKEVIEQEQQIFIEKAIKNKVPKDIAAAVYELILKFANYGFNKAHSVPYALISYQMAYLKSNYPYYFMANLLNMNIGSEIKTKEYLDETKKYAIKILKPDINQSSNQYLINQDSLLLPLNCIKNVGESCIKEILIEREKNGPYQDYFDFIARVYGPSVNRKTIESLIDAGAFAIFNINRQTLYNNLDNAITYAELRADVDENLIMKPTLDIFPEYDDKTLMQKEQLAFGFYITNHPCSKYQDKDIVKLNNIKQYFDKYIKTVVIINRIKKIKTKKNEEMAFLNAEDETGSGEYIIFPKHNQLLTKINQDDLITIVGQVTKRIDEYQIVVSNIEIIKEDKHE